MLTFLTFLVAVPQSATEIDVVNVERDGERPARLDRDMKEFEWDSVGVGIVIDIPLA
jgi:hypothetical protein